MQARRRTKLRAPKRRPNRRDDSITGAYLDACVQTLSSVLKECRWLEAHLPRQSPLHLEASLLSAAQMTQINQKFRGKAYATDVLSFRSEPVFFERGHLGEILLCRAVLNQQAKALGHSRREELWVLLVHGTLHLLGFDHETGKKDAARMAQAEVRLLKSLGGNFGRKTDLALIGRVKKMADFARPRHGHSKRNPVKK